MTGLRLFMSLNDLLDTVGAEHFLMLKILLFRSMIINDGPQLAKLVLEAVTLLNGWKQKLVTVFEASTLKSGRDCPLMST